ncbi:hypothetical protein CDAIGKPJ_01487 [Aeromonas salmonicida]|nr:putative flagellar hook-associated protein 3 [Aeromonas salmonicida subsp. masoucida NBRC 13784]
MRITTNMVYSRNITSLNNANERLSTAYEQLQSGDKFKTSGEDPSGMSQKMALTKEIDLFKQYGVNGSLLENSLGHGGVDRAQHRHDQCPDPDPEIQRFRGERR